MEIGGSCIELLYYFHVNRSDKITRLLVKILLKLTTLHWPDDPFPISPKLLHILDHKLNGRIRGLRYYNPLYLIVFHFWGLYYLLYK